MRPLFKQASWRHDPRSKRFSHHAHFGTITPAALPTTLGRMTRPPEDQGFGTVRCAAYAGALCGGYINGTRMSPLYQCNVISKIQGEDIDVSGSDPNAAMQSQVRPYGYCIADSDATAAPDKTNLAFVTVDGDNDTFDNIRSALTLAYDKSTGLGAVVQAFSKWYGEWTPAATIPTVYNLLAGYHSYDFVDFTEVNGVPYLIAQNSYGTKVGNGGFHLFPREVVNREFGIWGSSLKIVKPMSVAQIALASQESTYGLIQRLILQCWYAITEIYINRS